ncbi:MAG: hypothetical protein HOB88_14640, partial [Bacteroidetes bacterium]|nr:hypothetical protein [Bacteroidota bacterium]
TNWFRDYLFFPLAFSISNKLQKPKYLQLKTDYWIYFFAALITFGLTGFWHGASWSFLLWGLYHGAWLVINRFLLKKFFKRIGKTSSILITFIIVLIGWVLFRAENMNEAVVFLSQMFSLETSSLIFPFSFWLILTIGIFISFVPAFGKMESFFENIRSEDKRLPFFVIRYTITAMLLILCMSEIVSTGFNPFIYFRF